MTEFQWPPIYSFPPLFTLQPNADTRKKQLSEWTSLILSFYKHHKLSTLDISGSLGKPPFANPTINRKLDRDSLVTIVGELVARGNAEWEGTERQRCVVMWRSPAEWASMLYSLVKSKSMTNTVCTFYEITDADENSPFFGMERWLLTRVIRVLQKEGKAELMGDDGVKFFA